MQVLEILEQRRGSRSSGFWKNGEICWSRCRRPS